MRIAFVLALLDALVCLSAAPVLDGVFTLFGSNIGAHVEKRITNHLRAVPNLAVASLENAQEVADITRIKKGGNYLIFAAGNTSMAKTYAPVAGTTFTLDGGHTRDYLEPDSFRLRYEPAVQGFEWPALLSNGLPLSADRHKNTSLNKDLVHYGAVVGAYAALEALGFAFLHPLEPFVPAQASLARACEEGFLLQGSNSDSSSSSRCKGDSKQSSSDKHCCVIDTIEEPYWTERSFHLHTQHPIELTEVLQGHDVPQFGPHGPRCRLFSEKRERNKQRRREDAADMSEEERSAVLVRREAEKAAEEETPYCERWEDMVQDVDLMFEWAVANRQNKIEWLLLGNYKWGDEFHTRNNRLKLLTALGHRYSLLVGADVPLGNIQQHGWNIVNIRSPLKSQAKQIQTRVDWVFSAGFDFMTTESGLSEFHAPECGLMLQLLNEFATYVNGTWGREAGVKVHCSTGQVCTDFEDPITGDPLNFNFLPYYAHKGLGVFPHTIQMYSLDDPTAGTYGNKDFGYMEEYMVHEAKAGNRSVMFYPETAYWVNVDVDVPLFLPVYGQRRQHDLRRLARREALEDFKIDGQMNFDSGWEWGYWLSDIITARQAWRPTIIPSSSSSDSGADNTSTSSSSAPPCVARGRTAHGTGKPCTAEEYPEVHDTQWEAFVDSIKPVSRLFPMELGARLEQQLLQLTKAQARLLIRGEVTDGVPSPNLKKLSGIAYVSGGDTWIDLPHMLGQHTLQPTKIHLRETSDPDWLHVHPLLYAMETEFGKAQDSMNSLLGDALALFTSDSSIRITPQELLLSRKGETSSSSAGERERASARVLQAHPELDILLELADCVSVLALRARQVRLLYTSRHLQTYGSIPDYNPQTQTQPSSSSKVPAAAAGTGGESCEASAAAASAAVKGGSNPDKCAASASALEEQGQAMDGKMIHMTSTEIQKEARGAIYEAAAAVERMEAHYKVPWQRVAEWRENPTVYRYGYLWSVHSLYYWWRDQGLTEGGSVQSKYSPCYLNRMDLVEIGLGWGRHTLENLRAFVNTWSPFRSGYPLELLNCLAAPKVGYEFPRDLFK